MSSRPGVSQDTALRVLQYIQMRVGANRKLQEATSEIGKNLGVTHVTVHRALSALEGQGHISVDRTTHPLTIQLLSDSVVTQTSDQDLADLTKLIEDGQATLEGVSAIFDQIGLKVGTLAKENARLKKAAEIWLKLSPHLDSKMVLPQSDVTYQVILKFTDLTEVPAL